MNSRLFIGIILSISCVYGFVYGPWQLACVVIILALFLRYSALAIALSIAADLLYGQPSGLLHTVAIPYTLATLVCVVAIYTTRQHTRRLQSQYL